MTVACIPPAKPGVCRGIPNFLFHLQKPCQTIFNLDTYAFFILKLFVTGFCCSSHIVIYVTIYCNLRDGKIIHTQLNLKQISLSVLLI